VILEVLPESSEDHLRYGLKHMEGVEVAEGEAVGVVEVEVAIIQAQQN
jgi:hypothetical protein